MSQSIRGLYTGSKGKYRCGVCFYSIHQTSNLQDMLTHIRSAHPLTVVAWILRDKPESPEKLSVQAGDDQGDTPATPDPDSAPDFDEPELSPELSPEDLFLRSLSREKLKEWNMGSISCDSLQGAVQKIKSISELPKQHYIKCFFPCIVDGVFSVAVEQSRNYFSYPTKGHTEIAIRHIIKNAMELELDSVVGNLKSVHLVDVDYLPKYTSMPVEFQDYNNFRAAIDIQSLDICGCVDLIVGDEIYDEDYKVFRARLLGSKTIVDLHSMLYSPYLTPERQQPVYFCSCRLLSHYTKMDRVSFNTTVANFRKEWSNIAASSLRNQIPWKASLKNSKYQDLIHMLHTRVSLDGKNLEYEDTAAGNHEFIYNADRHINDKDKQQPKIKTLEDMHRIMKDLFRDYPYESWEYMHVRGYNAYFGSEECAYGLLNLVNKLIDTSDKNFRFPPLLQALKLCCIMLAKFHNLHQKNNPEGTPFARELEFAGIEIERCIKGLQSSNKEMHNCLLVRLEAYQLKDVDILVFKSIRIIVYALHFLYLLMNGKESIGRCMTMAFDRTWNSLSEFSKSDEFQMKISNARIVAMSSTTKWPSGDDVRKIPGLNFIFTDGGKSSFGEKIYGELNKLVEMLKEEPAHRE